MDTLPAPRVEPPFHDLLMLAEKEKIRADEKRARPQSGQHIECYVDLVRIGRAKNMQLQSEITGTVIQDSRLGFGVAIGRVHQQGNIGCLWHQSAWRAATPVMFPPGRLRLATSPD